LTEFYYLQKVGVTHEKVLFVAHQLFGTAAD
jgi:hypothetical protein